MQLGRQPALSRGPPVNGQAGPGPCPGEQLVANGQVREGGEEAFSLPWSDLRRSHFLVRVGRGRCWRLSAQWMDELARILGKIKAGSG